MRIVLYTSNQPRHVACVEALQSAGHDVTAIVEPKSYVPGGDSEILRRYWSYVQAAEREVFGERRPFPCPVYVLPMGEASAAQIMPEADRYAVFGSSFLKGPLVERLIEKDCLNLHIGMAPYYRGAACNFFADYDGRPEHIGAQVQALGQRVDQGGILLQAYGGHLGPDPFLRGMQTVKLGIALLVRVQDEPGRWTRYPNDPAKTLRHSRGQDFTEQVAANYLKRLGR